VVAQAAEWVRLREPDADLKGASLSALHAPWPLLQRIDVVLDGGADAFADTDRLQSREPYIARIAGLEERCGPFSTTVRVPVSIRSVPRYSNAGERGSSVAFWARGPGVAGPDVEV
jgi:hypothetical protein